MLPGDDDPSENGAPKSVPSRNPAATARPSTSSTAGSGGMKPKANIAQSYVGIVSGPSRLPVTSSESNAPRSQIKLQPGFDLKPKTPIAQSYVGVVTPTTRVSESTTSVSSSGITNTPQIRLQPGIDVKPKAAIAQSYVGIVSAPTPAANTNSYHAHTEQTFDDHDTFAPTTSVASSYSHSISHSYRTDSYATEHRPVSTSESYGNDYNYSHHRHSYAEALTSGDTLDSADFGISTSSELEGSLQSWSSNDMDIVSGDTAPRRRTYSTEPRVRSAHPVESHERPTPVSNHTNQFSNHTNQVSNHTNQLSNNRVQGSTNHVINHNTEQILPVSKNSVMPPSHSHQFEQPNLKTTHSHSQKSVQFAEELTKIKEYKVNTKKPISKSKLTSTGALPTKPILTSPKLPPTTIPSFETKPSHVVPTETSSQPSNQKPSLANKAWAKPTVFAQIAASTQEKRSPVVERKPVPQVQISRPQAQVLTTGRAPAQQTESSNNLVSAQDHTSNSGRGQIPQSNTLPYNWTPGFQSQASDSSNPSLEDLHLYTMPDLHLPPALPPRNGEKGKPSRILTSLGTDPTSRMTSRSSSSLPRSSAFSPPFPQGTGLEKRTLSNQALTGHLRGSPTPSIETQVSTRRDIETTFGTVAETAQTSRQLPQAQVAHTARRVNTDGSHVGIIETNL